MPDIHQPLLVNMVGHTAGAVIFGIFLMLFLKDRAGSGYLRGGWLSFSSAALAFLWDALSLTAIALSSARPRAVAAALSFSALSLLPAVLLHLSLEDDPAPRRLLRGIVKAGYALSALAVLLHLFDFTSAAGQAKRLALTLIPLGFGILTLLVGAALVFSRVPGTRSNASRIAGAMCLFLFAVSFVHFGSPSEGNAWSSELAIHHAGIPLALFILLQDYRFVLLDAFVRFLANVLLAGLLTFGAMRAGLRFPPFAAQATPNPVQEALLPVSVCLLLIGFALLRTRVQRLLTLVVFRRPDLEGALRLIRSRPHPQESEAAYIEWAAGQTGAFLQASRTEVAPPAEPNRPPFRWVEASVPLRLSHGGARMLMLGRRQGGRRYLSEDLEFLTRLAAAISEQVERLRVMEVERLVSQAELRALQSQINPHFLFNALNTLYGIIPREVAGARRTVLNLSEIFRYFLKSDRTFIPLGEEIQIVRAYLEIEALRLGSRLRTEIEVDPEALALPIPILSIQPLVENAVKHGVSPNPSPGWLRLRVVRGPEGLLVSVEDSGAGAGGVPESGGAGVGLNNVRRRLELCYGPGAELRFNAGPEGTRVALFIPLAARQIPEHAAVARA